MAEIVAVRNNYITGLPDFSRVTLKNMGRPGDEATLVS